MSDILGIIGGSGLYEMEGMRNVRQVVVRTPFGSPSDAITVGEIECPGPHECARVKGMIAGLHSPERDGKETVS